MTKPPMTERLQSLCPFTRPVVRAACVCLLAGALGACTAKAPKTPPELISAKGIVPLKEGTAQNVVKQAGGLPLSALIDDRIQLIGASIPKSGKPGQALKVTLWWQVKDTVKGEVKAFVHVAAKGAEMNTAQADHKLVGGAVEPSLWHPGDVLEDTFTLRLPHRPHADLLQVLVGLYDGNRRWPVTDGPRTRDNRIWAGEISVPGAPPANPSLKAVKRKGPIAIDGVLGEPDWERAQKVGPFISYDGKSRIKNKTWARLLWDESNLYIGFECDDTDVHTPYKKNDDPLYNSEAVEIFIDADGDKNEYVELQAAPNNLHFDAAFKGGRRKNFDTSYNVAYQTAVKVNGTLNQGSDVDKGWVSEWRIPISELRDIPSVPKVGNKWMINLFRLDRPRRGDKVVGNEASAWSSPLSGDFHNLDRFGTLIFAP